MIFFRYNGTLDNLEFKFKSLKPLTTRQRISKLILNEEINGNIFLSFSPLALTGTEIIWGEDRI